MNKLERNERIKEYYKTHKTTYRKMAKMFKISSARIGQIMNKGGIYRTKKRLTIKSDKGNHGLLNRKAGAEKAPANRGKNENDAIYI